MHIQITRKKLFADTKNYYLLTISFQIQPRLCRRAPPFRVLYNKSNIIKKSYFSPLTGFRKTFDRIGLPVVLEKLKIWGVGKKIFGLVRSFQTNRKFYTRANNFYSSTYSLHSGIPQGSSLSVVLFIIAFDEISSLIKKYKLLDSCFYADDINILNKLNGSNKCKTRFDNVINDILEWSCASGAKLSLQKCKILHLCRKTNCLILLTINNVQIENVNKS